MGCSQSNTNEGSSKIKNKDGKVENSSNKNENKERNQESKINSQGGSKAHNVHTKQVQNEVIYENYNGENPEKELSTDELILEINQGTLADNRNIYFDILMKNDEDLASLTGSIAKQVVKYISRGDGVMPDVRYVDNDSDAFLNKKCNVDFNSQRLLVLIGGKASEIKLDSDKGQVILKFSTNLPKENEYWAYLLDTIFDELVITNDKPMPIIEQRAQNMNFEVFQQIEQ